MFDHATLYCDESGNDGPNYLSLQDLFYVLAGWIIPTAAEAQVAAEIEATRRRNCPDAKELKFKTFKKSEGKLQAALELFKKLNELGLVPVYLFAEKRYCVAGKIVETFLDPIHNERVKNGISWDAIAKQEFANSIYDRVSDETLQRFALAYRKPTVEGLTLALKEIVVECRTRVNPELAELLEGSAKALDEISNAEVQAALVWGKAGDTLNLPCLIAFFMIVEHLSRCGMYSTCTIVHDEQGPYQESYHQAFLHYQGWPNHWELLWGQKVPYGALRSIKNFSTQPSLTQPLVQTADMLAGAINHICISLLKSKVLTQAEEEIAKLFLPLMLDRNITLASPVCSDRMLAHVARSFQSSVRSSEVPVFHHSVPVIPSAPLQLLPVAGATQIVDQMPKFPITIPIYGIASKDRGHLVLIALDNGANEPRSFIPLFTDRESADNFLLDNQSDWSEPHEICSFGPDAVLKLIEQLEALLPWSQLTILHGPESSTGVLELAFFIDDLQRIWERAVRAVESGIMDVLYKRQTIEGKEIVSYLLASGEYVAKSTDNNTLFSGATREEAISRLLSSY